MKPHQLTESFDVVGLFVRTSNATPQRIGALWQVVLEEHLAARLPAAESGFYSVYSDYEGDHTQSFQVLVGLRVPTGSPIPDDLHRVMVQPGRYLIFDASGEQPTALKAAWQTVWNTPLARAYRTDFEHHGEDGVTRIYLGVYAE